MRIQNPLRRRLQGLEFISPLFAIFSCQKIQLTAIRRLMNLKAIFVLALAYAVSINSLAQDKTEKNIVSISSGRISFGTGDFFGYGVNIDYSSRLSPKKPFLKHFSVGAELSFDHGDEQPKVINPSPHEFTNESYYSTTNIVLTSKFTYNPFRKTFAKGIYTSGGLSVGYTNQSFEKKASYDSVGQISLRTSYLEFINRVVFGYRIIVGYDYPITKHVLLGLRMDFDNYSGDINTLFAGKIGYAF